MDKIGEKIGFLAVLLTMMSISSSPYPMMLILAYIIHELGHIIIAKINHIPMRKFKIGSFRLSLSYDCSGVPYKKELFVCLGGIAFNLLFASLMAILKLYKYDSISFFILCNLSLALMNLYPVSTLDGGGILKCLLMMLFDTEKAEKISKIISLIAVFILWLCAVYLQLVFDSNISMLFISIFLLIELCFSC
ncbi:MAG: site-2 protease family protein [Clostridia bacterium]|nr:site-2 protease family protein [Clostridia bacterium]